MSSQKILKGVEKESKKIKRVLILVKIKTKNKKTNKVDKM